MVLEGAGDEKIQRDPHSPTKPCQTPEWVIGDFAFHTMRGRLKRSRMLDRRVLGDRITHPTEQTSTS